MTLVAVALSTAAFTSSGCATAPAQPPQPPRPPEPLSERHLKFLKALEDEAQMMEQWHCVVKGSAIDTDASRLYSASARSARAWVDTVNKMIDARIPLTSSDEDELRKMLQSKPPEPDKARLAFIELILKHRQELRTPEGCVEPPDISRFECRGMDTLTCAGIRAGPFLQITSLMMLETAKVTGEESQRGVLKQWTGEVNRRLWK